jgi:AcrR family transcriptional regulator
MAAACDRSVAERIKEALLDLEDRITAHPSERVTVASLCRRAGISRNTLYLFYPDALTAIRKLQDRTRQNVTDGVQLRHLRAELARANSLIEHLSALADHYARAYQEAQELISRRERELAELRRSRGSLPTALRRAGLT